MSGNGNGMLRSVRVLLVVAILLTGVGLYQNQQVRNELGAREAARAALRSQLDTFAETSRKLMQERWNLLQKRFDDLDEKLDAHLKDAERK